MMQAVKWTLGAACLKYCSHTTSGSTANATRPNLVAELKDRRRIGSIAEPRHG